LWDGRAASRIIGILAERLAQDLRCGENSPQAEVVELGARSASVGGQI